MSIKANAIKNLYIRGKIDIDGLKRCVRDGIISQEEYYLIAGEQYEQ